MTSISTEQIRILHVDDEPDFADLVKTHLEREDDRFIVETTESASKALDLLAETGYDCIVSDYDMPGRNGIEFLSTVREKFPDLPFILFTGKGSEEVASRAISEGVSDYLQKQPGTERYEILANRIVNHVERTKAQRELKEREQELQLFREAVEAAGHCIYWTDRDGILQYVNPAFEDTTGYSAEEAIGRNPRILQSGEHSQEFYNALWTTILSGDVWRSEVTNTTRSGETYVVDQTIAPVTDESGDITHFVAVNANITEQNRSKEELRRARDRREALFQNPNNAIIEDKFDGDSFVIQDVNEAFVEVFGHESDAVVGEAVGEVLVPDEVDAQANYDEIRQRLLDGEGFDRDVRRQTRDGPREFRMSIFPLDVGDGQLGSYAIYTDITERKERETQLERYETIIEASGDAVYMIDSDGYFTFVNEALIEITGYSESEIVGEHVTKVMAEEDIETGTRLIQELLAGEKNRGKFEMAIHTAEGEVISMENHIAVLTDADGSLKASAGIVRDISERKAREERLEQFTSIVSHDLRNPLSVAIGSQELAREDCESEHLDRVAGALERMNTLIEELQMWTQVGEEIEAQEPVAVSELIERSWQTVPTANAQIRIASDLMVTAERSRLRQLIENLLRNAVEHGGETVSITVGALADENGFYIEDDGPGITDAEPADVFESGYSREEDSTGLGLAIVREIVDAHSWDISVTESEMGGARFEISGVEIAE